MDANAIEADKENGCFAWVTVSQHSRLVAFTICECYPRSRPVIPSHGGYEYPNQAEHNEEDELTMKGTEYDWLDKLLLNIV